MTILLTLSLWLVVVGGGCGGGCGGVGGGVKSFLCQTHLLFC